MGGLALDADPHLHLKKTEQQGALACRRRGSFSLHVCYKQPNRRPTVMMWALGHALCAVRNPVGAAQLWRARNEPSSGSYAVVPTERTRSMNCCGPVVLATAVAAMIGFGSPALAQALQPAGPTQAPVLEQAPRAPATTPAQPSPPGMGATAAP